MRTNPLQEHITRTYFSLRTWMYVIGFMLPVVLIVVGLLREPELGVRTSMSDYYNSAYLRDVFVGALISIGVMLILYRGFSKAEAWALDGAGVLAIGTALVPTGTRWHGVLAVAFFACIAYVCLFRAEDTLDLLNPEDRALYKRTYRSIGVLMLALPIAAAVLAVVLFQSRVILVVEWAAVWVFGSYWAVKSREFSRTHAEERAAAGALHTVGTPPPRKRSRLREVRGLGPALSEAFGDQVILEVDRSAGPVVEEPPRLGSL
jgi:hypothetical protein